MIVITGGCGFLGSALVWHLNRMGRTDIVVVDHLGRTEKFRNIAGFSISDYFEKDDFFHRIEINAPLPDVDAIVHLGACSATTEEDGSFLMLNNFEFSRTLAQWSLRRGTRFVYASSAATFGDGCFGFGEEPATVPRLRPLNKYAFSKQIMDLWAHNNGAFVHITGLKYFNVFGPNEYHKGNMRSMVHRAFEQVRDTGTIQLFRSYRSEFADGEQERDFIYVKDAVAMTAWFLEHPEATGIFNIGTGVARTWNDLAGSVFRSMRREVRIEYIDMPGDIRSGYQYSTHAELRRLKAMGGPMPVYSLEEAIHDYVQTYLLGPDAYLRL